MHDGAKLAIAAGALAVRLRRGEAVIGTAGNPAPGRADADPGVLIDLLVVLCRSAGMSGPEMAARFNEAVERR